MFLTCILKLVKTGPTYSQQTYSKYFDTKGKKRLSKSWWKYKTRAKNYQ